MKKRNEQGIAIFLVLFVIACFNSGCSQEPTIGEGTPTDVLFVYMLVSIATLLVFIAILIFLIIKNNRMNKRYKDQTTTLSTIYNSVPDTVFTKDKSGAYTSCNLVLAKLHGRSELEMIGKTSEELYRDREQVKFIANSDYRVLNEKKPVREQAWLTFENGGSRFFETMKVPLIQDGEVKGLLGIGRDMTEFKSLLDELNKTQKLTELMLDTIPFCCIMINKEHKCFTCNSEATRLFKLKTKQEFIENYTNLSPKYQPDGWLSSKLSQVYFEKVFEEGKCSFEWMHQQLDGTLIPALITLVRVTYNNDHVVIAYVRDMREHVQMLDEIEKQNTLLKTLNHVSAMLLDPDTDKFENNLFDSMFIIAEAIDVARVSIWRNYSRGERLYCTLAYEWQSEDLPKTGISPDLSYTDNIPGCEDQLAKGKCLNIVAHNMTQEQPHEVLSAFAVPVFVRDKFWGFVAFDDRHSEHKFVKNEELILRSISRMIACTLIRNELARDIRTTTSQLEIMVKEAHKASRAKSDFLAKMSHEIRTPMNAIAGMAELALREKELESTHRHIFTIKQASANLLSIINDILDFTKIESGKFEIIPDYYQFSSLMNDVISIIRMRAIDSQLRFAVYIDNNIPNELYGDETRIRQVLINVLGNAVKYTDVGFITFTVKGCLRDADTIDLTIDIMDTGRGIKKENLKELFVDFVQFDTVKNRNIEGTGLGLAITWNILKAVGGDIQVFSEYGKGSLFTITLPQKFRSPEGLAHIEDAEKKNVLIYERRDIYADSIVATLDNLGVSSELVSEAAEFFDRLAAKTFSFIFIAHALYRQYKSLMLEVEKTSRIVLITEFGEATSNDGRSVLAMPAHCVSVATIMNGLAEAYSYKEDDDSLTHFIASDAAILVVDDIKTNLIIAEGLLLPYNLQIDLCKSGAEAIAAVQSKHYDLVFMDHWMPEMDGVEATKRIRALGGGENSYYKRLPIIALTANVISGTQDMFIENGLNGFLAKPIDTVMLNIVLERWIPKEKRKSAVSHDCGKPCTDPDGRAAKEKERDSLPAFKVSGLDTRKGLVLTGGSLERYLETLNVFCCDGREKIQQLKTCLEAGNIPLYTILVHALKSACANIGAEELSAAAGDLEAAGKRSDMCFIEEYNHRLFAVLEVLLSNIHDAVAAHREKTEVSPDAELLKTRLTELKHALETLDARVMNEVAEHLLRLSLPAETASVVQSISRNILMSDYDKALALTESLLEESPDG